VKKFCTFVDLCGMKAQSLRECEGNAKEQSNDGANFDVAGCVSRKAGDSWNACTCGQHPGALAGGETMEQVQEDYPGITRADVYAALRFAGELAQCEEVAGELVSA
jgi:hypothetical protein